MAGAAPTHKASNAYAHIHQIGRSLAMTKNMASSYDNSLIEYRTLIIAISEGRVLVIYISVLWNVTTVSMRSNYSASYRIWLNPRKSRNAK